MLVLTAYIVIYTKQLVSTYCKAEEYLSFNHVMMALLSLFLVMIYGFQPGKNILAFGIIIVLGILDALANWLNFKLTDWGNPKDITAILNLSPIIGLLLYPIFSPILDLKPLKITVLIGIFIIIFGVLLIIKNKGGFFVDTMKKHHMIRFFLFGVLLASISAIFGYTYKWLLNDGGVNIPSFFLLRNIIMFSVYSIIFKSKWAWIKKEGKIQWFTLWRPFMVFIQFIGILYLYKIGNPLITKVFLDGYIIAVLPLSYFILKDKITKIQILGSIIVLIGMFLLNV